MKPQPVRRVAGRARSARPAVRRPGRGRRGRPGRAGRAAACATRCATCCGAGRTGGGGLDDLRGAGPPDAPRGDAPRASSTAPSPGPSSCSTRRSRPSATSCPAATTTTPGSPSPCWTTCRARPRGRSRSCPTTSGPATRPAALYQQILDGLRQEVVEQRFRGMKQALSDPAAQQAAAEMMRDLNALLERHARGEDTTDQFAEFMAKHGEYFPENPPTSTSWSTSLARRAAAGERLMRSLSPAAAGGTGPPDGSRRSATAPLGQRDGGARRQPARAAAGPRLGPARARCAAAQPLGYGEAAGALEEIGDLDDLLDQLGQEHPGRHAGRRRRRRGLPQRSAATPPTTCAGCRSSNGSCAGRAGSPATADGLTLSPKALRRLGGTALRTVFADLGARPAGPARPARRRCRRRGDRRVRGRGSSATRSRSTSCGRCPVRCCGPATGTPVRLAGRGLRGGGDRAPRVGRGGALRRPVGLDGAARTAGAR